MDNNLKKSLNAPTTTNSVVGTSSNGPAGGGGGVSHHTNPITKKLNKILESKLETDQDMLGALDTVSQFFSKNTLQNRRNLRRDIESRSLQTNLQFLESFRRVKEKLDAVASDVNSMDQCCKTMTEHLRDTKEQTRDLINRTTNLQAESLEIMERMASHQEAAYELLYRWIQRECRLLNIDFVELNPLLCQAFEAMQEREVLFKYSLDEFSTARRNNMVRSFIDALTRGGPGGVPKPIELLSHDPLRYVGDMLAWIHQSMASEKELLQALLKYCKEESLKEQLPGILTHITDGLCRPFKVRVEQVLSGENGPVVLYKLSNMFIFYTDTMKPSLLDGASLLHAVAELKELTLNLFYSSLTNNLQRLLDKIEPPSQDLLPVQGLHQILLLLRDVLESHDTTLVPVVDKKENFAKIFSVVLEPLQQTLLLSATHLSVIDLAVYTLNCLSSIHALLALYEYTDTRLEMIQAQVQVHEDVLVGEQAGYILNRIGMFTAYNTALKHRSNQEKFDLFLASPDSYRLPQCNLLTSTKIRETVTKRTMTAICEAYDTIESKVRDPINNYQNPTHVAPKDAGQIRELLLS